MEISSPKAAEAYLMNEEYQRKMRRKTFRKQLNFLKQCF